MIRKLKSGRYPAVFPQERFQSGQTKKSRHLQQQGCGEETRTRGSVFQAALERDCFASRSDGFLTVDGSTTAGEPSFLV